MLRDKVDFSTNGEDSKIGRRIQRIRKRKYNAARRARKKYEGEESGETTTLDDGSQ